LLSNDEPHHVYEIRDKQDDDTFKYGISSDPIGADGLSKRIRIQLNILNIVDNWERFYAVILVENIESRVEAKKIESKFIKTYRLKKGRNPKGNIQD
jgi:URI fold toxin 2